MHSTHKQPCLRTSMMQRWHAAELLLRQPRHPGTSLLLAQLKQPS